MNSKRNLACRLLLACLLAFGFDLVYEFVVQFIWTTPFNSRPLDDDYCFQELTLAVDWDHVSDLNLKNVSFVQAIETVTHETSDKTLTDLDGNPLPKTYASGGDAIFRRTADFDGKTQGKGFGRWAGVDDDCQWFFLPEDKSNDSGYLIGCKGPSRIGYIGLKGFSETKPPRDERIPVNAACKSSLEFDFQHIQLGVAYVRPSSSPAVIFYNSKRIYEVNFFDRSIRVLANDDGIIEVKRFGWQRGDANSVSYRTKNAVVIFKLGEDAKRRFVLPDEFRDEALGMLGRADRSLLVYSRDRSVSYDADGKITQTKKYDLRAESWPTVKSTILHAAFCPSFTDLFGLSGPSSVPNTRGFPVDMHERYRVRPAVYIVAVISALCAVFCVRRQRKFKQPYTVVWAVFVFLFGLPGYVGYRLHRRWPALETCPSCGKRTPRDRELCARCDAEFPAPRKLGTEIFA